MSDYIERDKIFSVWRSIPAPASLASLAAAISQTPSADVAPVRHGRWNDINPAVLKPSVNWVCRCSECGCPQDYKHNYCPNCGARMDGKEGKHETD